jgi:hypothetical protein
VSPQMTEFKHSTDKNVYRVGACYYIYRDALRAVRMMRSHRCFSNYGLSSFSCLEGNSGRQELSRLLEQNFQSID